MKITLKDVRFSGKMRVELGPFVPKVRTLSTLLNIRMHAYVCMYICVYLPCMDIFIENVRLSGKMRVELGPLVLKVRALSTTCALTTFSCLRYVAY